MSWGGRILCKVESLMMILFYKSIDSFSPPSSGRLNIILYIYLVETCNNNFGTTYFFGL